MGFTVEAIKTREGFKTCRGSARAGMLSTDIRSVETGDPCVVQLGGAFILPFIAGDRNCRTDRADRTKDH